MTVTVDGVHHPLTRGRDRGVLAVLLAAHGVPVPADRLVAEVWGADAPPTALGLLQVSVSRLRGILEPDRASRAGIRLVSTGAGYAVRAGQDEVDTWAFEDAAAAVAAAGSPADVAIQAEEAERWWTGDPYAGCTAPAVVAEADRLRELRLVVQESVRPGARRHRPPERGRTAAGTSCHDAALSRGAVVPAGPGSVPVRAAGRGTGDPAHLAHPTRRGPRGRPVRAGTESRAGSAGPGRRHRRAPAAGAGAADHHRCVEGGHPGTRPLHGLRGRAAR